MPIVDCDAHVVETEHTWEYMDRSEMQYRPELVRPRGESGREYWLIDGKIRGLGRAVITAEAFADLSRKAGRKMDTPQETREMENVGARVHHMDELGVDVQVLYPTIFIQETADRPEVDIAISKSYNRWMAELCKGYEHRLKWICVLPLLNMSEALDQLRWCHQQGAVGVFMRGVEGNRLLQDPYFYPLYDEMCRLDMAVGVHIGNSNSQMCDLLSQYNGGGTFWKFRLASVGACHSLIMSELADQFPTLRWHFAEAAAQWVPYVLKDLKRRWPARGKVFPEDALARFNIWVSCQTDDDVAYLLKYTGEDNVVIGTDYGHNDQSSEVEALRNLKDSGEVTPQQYTKIVDTNPRALFTLNL